LPNATLTRAIDALCSGHDLSQEETSAVLLEIMEGKITSLIVVDESQRPRGVIHLHDILRAKII